jgi:predicted MFS family arabinose efflux permease
MGKKSKVLSTNADKYLLLISTVFFWSSLYIFVPILSPHAKNLGGSLTVIGLVVASYGFTQFLFRFPIGIWSDNTGRRKPFALSGFLFTIASCIGMALAPNPWILMIFRGLSGVSASMWVAFTVMYSSYFEDSQSTKAMSHINFCTGFAQMLSTYSGGNIAENYKWTTTFYFGAGLAIIGLLLMLPVSERKLATRAKFSLKRLAHVASRKRLIVVSIITSLSNFSVFVTTYGFLSIYAFDKVGMTESQLGILMFVIHFMQTISTYLAGTYVAPKFGYKATVSFSFITIAIVTAFTTHIQSAFILILLYGIGTLGRGLAGPILMGLAIQGVPREEKATAMGFYQAVYAIGMFGGPAIGGFIGDIFGLSGVFYCAGFIFLISFIVSAIMLPNRIDQPSMK